MNLFDDITRTSEEARTHIESHYVFLNRSAWPVCQRIRDEMQSWLDKVPEDEQGELSNRMRFEFPAAFFEPLLHEILVRSGFDITFHPALQGTSQKPDFLAVRRSTAFYLEAVVATHIMEEWKRRKLRMRSCIPSTGCSASRYCRPERPFVIAVNSISEWGTDQTEIMETLFGTEQFTFVRERLEPFMHRAPDGVFFGPAGPRNTRVSRVIVGTVLPWTLA